MGLKLPERCFQLSPSAIPVCQGFRSHPGCVHQNFCSCVKSALCQACACLSTFSALFMWNIPMANIPLLILTVKKKINNVHLITAALTISITKLRTSYFLTLVEIKYLLGFFHLYIFFLIQVTAVTSYQVKGWSGMLHKGHVILYSHFLGEVRLKLLCVDLLRGNWETLNIFV